MSVHNFFEIHLNGCWARPGSLSAGGGQGNRGREGWSHVGLTGDHPCVKPGHTQHSAVTYTALKSHKG
jgi:hypothetical protein